MSDLVGDIRTGITDISVHLAHDADVFVTVEERVLLLALNTVPAGSSVRGLVGLEAGIAEHHNEPL